ncbi:glycosyltransferase family 9 protein [Candidatus Woesearchaeota archaeon]|nr:glycosyltransferase family 9 protein [Candidatus Woesearchaeota archaeon]
MIIKILRFVDTYLLVVAVLFFGFFNKLFFAKKTSKKNILIIKLWALGDSIVLLPTIKALKNSFPKSKIDVLVRKRNRDVFEGQKSVNNIIDFGFFSTIKLFRNYDLCIDAEPYLNSSALISFFSARQKIGFSHGLRSLLYNKKVLFDKKNHMILNYFNMAKMAGAKTSPYKLEKLYYSPKDKKIVDLMLEKVGFKDKKLIGISPGVAESVKSRMWPAENFSKLIKKLSRELKANIVIVDSNANKLVADQIVKSSSVKVLNLAGRTSIRQTFYLIEKFDVLITNDTGPAHIGAAQGTTTLGLYGPNTPVLWKPYNNKSAWLYHPPYCSPCIDNAKGIMPKCYNKLYQKCMLDIKVEEVFKKTVELLRK